MKTVIRGIALPALAVIALFTLSPVQAGGEKTTTIDNTERLNIGSAGSDGPALVNETRQPFNGWMSK